MRALILSIALCTALTPLAAQAAEPAAVTAGPFDPSRDSFKDLAAAKAEARQSGRRILMDVGGNWCPWCRRLDLFWSTHPVLKASRDHGFVFLMVNYSKEQKNAEFLGKFPKVPGFPHLFVLDADGKVLQSQDTGVLEDGLGYSEEKLAAFLSAWKP